MAVKYDHNDGGTGIFTTVDPPASGTTYDFSRWVADVDVGIRNFSFEPSVSSAPPGCVVEYGTSRVHIIEHPLQNNALQYYVDRRVLDLVWDGSQYVFDVRLHASYDGYDFVIPIINIDGERKLPVLFPDPPPVLDYIGAQENRMGGAAFNTGGTLDLDGNVTINLLRVRSRSSPMNLPSIINGIAPCSRKAAICHSTPHSTSKIRGFRFISPRMLVRIWWRNYAKFTTIFHQPRSSTLTNISRCMKGCCFPQQDW